MDWVWALADGRHRDLSGFLAFSWESPSLVLQAAEIISSDSCVTLTLLEFLKARASLLELWINATSGDPIYCVPPIRVRIYEVIWYMDFWVQSISQWVQCTHPVVNFFSSWMHSWKDILGPNPCFSYLRLRTIMVERAKQGPWNCLYHTNSKPKPIFPYKITKLVLP